MIFYSVFAEKRIIYAKTMLLYSFSRSNVEAALLQFVFDVALAILFQVSQHFGQYKFQCVGADVLQGAAVFVFYFFETFPTDVECSAVGVGRIARSVSVAAAQALHVVLGAEYGGDDDFIRIQSFRGERIEEIASDAVQQVGCAGHEVGDGVCERVDSVEVVGLDVAELLLQGFGFLTRTQGSDADGAGYFEVFGIEVAEGTLIADDALDVARFVQFEGHVFLFAATEGGRSYGCRKQHEGEVVCKSVLFHCFVFVNLYASLCKSHGKDTLIRRNCIIFAPKMQGQADRWPDAGRMLASGWQVTDRCPFLLNPLI